MLLTYVQSPSAAGHRLFLTNTSVDVALSGSHASSPLLLEPGRVRLLANGSSSLHDLSEFSLSVPSLQLRLLMLPSVHLLGSEVSWDLNGKCGPRLASC